MPYEAVKPLDPDAEDGSVDIVGGSEADVESSKTDADETLSFLRWKQKGDASNSNPAQVLSRRGAGDILAAICSLLPWIINLILVMVVISLARRLNMTPPASSRLPGSELMYTLAEEAIEYRLETTYASEDFPDSEYQGWPNAHKDKLWNKYEDGNFLWIDQQTAERLPFETEHAPLQEHMDDYVVGLSVFHVLHCLSVLRRNIYPRRYNSSMVNPDGTVDYHKWHHIDHCLETVRRDVLCHADTSATTWEWVEASQMTIRPETQHICRDFDRISEWAYARHVKGNQRTHVENGKIVDYTGLPPSEAWNKIQVLPPADWAYTVDDL